jgi:hypothetical protein
MTEKKAGRGFDKADFQEFVGEFKAESDRAAVILGAAKLDLLLYQIIQQYLAPNTGGKDELLDGDSPLGTFSSKIMLANRLGLIDNEFTRSLQFVRKIRNSFAHEVSGCTLNSGSHRDRVKELVAQLKHKNAFILVREAEFDGKDEPSENFRTALAFLVARLDVLLSHIETIDCSKALNILNEAARDMGEVDNPRKKPRTSTGRTQRTQKLTNQPSGPAEAGR